MARLAVLEALPVVPFPYNSQTSNQICIIIYRPVLIGSLLARQQPDEDPLAVVAEAAALPMVDEVRTLTGLRSKGFCFDLKSVFLLNVP